MSRSTFMNKSTHRKIILLSLSAILLCTYIIQLAVSSANNVKEVRFKKEITSIEVKKGNITFNISKNAEGLWKVCENGGTVYEADSNAAGALEDALENLKLLGNASSNQNDIERYGLSKDSRITVVAKNADEILHTIYAGKNSSIGNQSYVQIDTKNSISIANNPMSKTFSLTLDSLRSKKVFSTESKSIERIMLSKRTKENDFAKYSYIKKTVTAESDDSSGSEGPGMAVSKDVWEYTAESDIPVDEEGNQIAEPDQNSISSLASYLSNIRADSWITENVNPGNRVASVEYVAEGKTVGLELYAASDEEEKRYVCKCSESPYWFYASEYFGKSIAE